MSRQTLLLKEKVLFFPGRCSPRPGQTLVRAGFWFLSPLQYPSPAFLRGESRGQGAWGLKSLGSQSQTWLSIWAPSQPTTLVQYTNSSVQEPCVTGHGGISVQTDKTKDPEAEWYSGSIRETNVMGPKWAKGNWKRWGQTWGSLILIIFFICLVAPYGIWDLSSPTTVGTCASCSGSTES